jgi:hypothetical protein
MLLFVVLNSLVIVTLSHRLLASFACKLFVLIAPEELDNSKNDLLCLGLLLRLGSTLFRGYFWFALVICRGEITGNVHG